MNILLFVLTILSLLISIIFRFTLQDDPLLYKSYQAYFDNQKEVFKELQKKEYIKIKKKSTQTKKKSGYKYPNRRNPRSHHTFNLGLIVNASKNNKKLCIDLLQSKYPKIDAKAFLKEVTRVVKDKKEFSIKDLIEMDPPYNEQFYKMLKGNFEDYFVFKPLSKRKPLIFNRTKFEILKLILPPKEYETWIAREKKEYEKKQKPSGRKEFHDFLKNSSSRPERADEIFKLFVFSTPKEEFILVNKNNIPVRRKLTQ